MAVIRKFSFYDAATGGNPDQLIYDAMMATRVEGYHQKTLAFLRLTEIMIPYLVAEINGKRGDPDQKGHFIEGLTTLGPHYKNPVTGRSLGPGSIHWINYMERVDVYFKKEFLLHFDMVICLDPEFRETGSPLSRLFARVVRSPHTPGELVALDLDDFTKGRTHWIWDGVPFTNEDWAFTLFGNLLNISGGDMQNMWIGALNNPVSYEKRERELAEASKGAKHSNDVAQREAFRKARQRAVDASNAQRDAKGQSRLTPPKRW